MASCRCFVPILAKIPSSFAEIKRLKLRESYSSFDKHTLHAAHCISCPFDTLFLTLKHPFYAICSMNEPCRRRLCTANCFKATSNCAVAGCFRRNSVTDAVEMLIQRASTVTSHVRIASMTLLAHVSTPKSPSFILKQYGAWALFSSRIAAKPSIWALGTRVGSTSLRNIPQILSCLHDSSTLRSLETRYYREKDLQCLYLRQCLDHYRLILGFYLYGKDYISTGNGTISMFNRHIVG